MARAYLRGLLLRTERKSGWALSEQVGDTAPDGMQRLLNHAAWCVDKVRDCLRGYEVDHLGHKQAVLVADETGFLRKGVKSAGRNGSTPLLPGGSRTASPACSWTAPARTSADRPRALPAQGQLVQ
jgi:hypothetical protein